MKYIWILVVCISLFSACQTDNLEGNFVVGSEYLSVNNKVLLIDTLTVEVSTINFDSLITSNQGRILIGNYTDPIVGKVNSDSYFELTPSSFDIGNSGSDTENITYAFDSIALILKYDRYYYGDTTKTQIIDVHQLTQKIKPNLDNTDFYNNSTLSYNSNSIGSKTYHPKPSGNDSIPIRISNSFGKNLFDKLKNNEFTTTEEFQDYFKGIILKSSPKNSSCVVGFNTSSVIRMYYKQTNSSAENALTKDFYIANTNKQFNNITLDRTGTVIENLPDSRNKLSSETTNNSSFIQSGTGLACRVDFPYIQQLKYISQKGIIVDAELIIKPIKNSASFWFPIKDSLQVYECDPLNRITKILAKSDGSAAMAVLNNTPDEFNENIGYTINISSFLYQEMQKTAGKKSALIFTFPNIFKGVDRIVLGNQKNAENKLKLKIYYLSY